MCPTSHGFVTYCTVNEPINDYTFLQVEEYVEEVTDFDGSQLHWSLLNSIQDIHERNMSVNKISEIMHEVHMMCFDMLDNMKLCVLGIYLDAIVIWNIDGLSESDLWTYDMYIKLPMNSELL